MYHTAMLTFPPHLNNVSTLRC